MYDKNHEDIQEVKMIKSVIHCLLVGGLGLSLLSCGKDEIIKDLEEAKAILDEGEIPAADLVGAGLVASSTLF